MTSLILHAVLGAILQFEICYAITRIFTMRSKALYYAVFVIDSVVNELLLAFGLRMAALSLILSLLWIFTPLILSYGSLRMRLSRALVVDLVYGVIEALGTFVYALLSGGQAMPRSIYDMNPVLISGTYFALIALTGIALEILVTIYARIDQRQSDAHVEAPVFVFIFGASLLSGIINSTLGLDVLGRLVPALLSYALISLALGVALIVASRREHLARLEEVRRDAELRQVDQLRGMVAADARRIGATRRLRHDLANQVAVVRQLATLGELAETDRYLAQLQDQARTVAGRADA